MENTTIVVSLPIKDRRSSFAFYRDGLGLEPFGAPADDGVPEPLQFVLNSGCRIMLIPVGGFDWITGAHPVADPGVSECVLAISTRTDAQAGDMIRRALDTGATIVTEPGPQPWGYAGAFADPDGHIWMIRSDSTTL